MATGMTGHSRPTKTEMPLATGMPQPGISRTPGATTTGIAMARLPGNAANGATTAVTIGTTTAAVVENRLGKGGATPHRPPMIPPADGGPTAGGRRRPRRPPPAPGKIPSPLALGSHVRGTNGPNRTTAARTTRTKPTNRSMEERMPSPCKSPQLSPQGTSLLSSLLSSNTKGRIKSRRPVLMGLPQGPLAGHRKNGQNGSAPEGPVQLSYATTSRVRNTTIRSTS